MDETENEKNDSTNDMYNGVPKNDEETEPETIPSASPPTSNTADNLTTPCKQFGLIDINGICTTCEDADAKDHVLCCFLGCGNLFHGVCRDAKGDKKKNETISTRSFFNSFEAQTNNKSRPGNFVFICDFCMTKHEHEMASTEETKVDTLNKRVNNLSHTIDEIKSLLNTAINSPAAPLQPVPTIPTANSPTQSWANMASKPLKRSVLLLENKDGSTITDDAVNKKVNKLISDNKIPIDESFKSKSGKMAFVCPTEEDRKTLDKKLGELIPSVKTSLPQERLPTIAIANLCMKYSEVELHDKILSSQPKIKECIAEGEQFQVLPRSVKSHRYNENKFQATIRVSTKIRHVIENQGDKLYFNDPSGNFSCSVFDRFHVKRCNKCQRFGHYLSDCPETKHTCGYCSKDHESEKCPLDPNNYTPCCINCKNHNKFDYDKHSHTAFDRTCRAYGVEQDKLRKSINFYNQKN